MAKTRNYLDCRRKREGQKGTVEFKAYYLNSASQPRVHHEHSRFIKELGKWFYIDGKVYEEM